MDNTVKQEVENFLNRTNSFLVSSRLLFCSDINNHCHHPLTGLYLNFICLELIIKSFWMIEKDEKSPHTHDVYKLFTELSDETKDHIKESFYNNESRKEIFNDLRDKIKEHENKELPEEDFKAILKQSEDIVKNFKYNQSALQNVLGGQHLDFLHTLRRELSKNCRI